jgi:histidine triad (HIT) family protein
MDNCIFCKIVAGEVPSRKVYEDEGVLAFNDIHPIAPVHFMLIPKEHVDSLDHCDESHQGMLGKLLLLAPKLAREQGLTDGFRLIVNTGRGGHQEVMHLHMHVVGGGLKVPGMSDTLKKL